MGQKDMVEKIMEDYSDVFADIVNVLLFDGKQVVSEEDLKETGMRSQFKADTGMIHEEERDVGKYWIRDGKVQAMIGLENQSCPDGVMPMRIIICVSSRSRTCQSDSWRCSEVISDCWRSTLSASGRMNPFRFRRIVRYGMWTLF